MSEIRDESLWESGKRKIEWVRQNMSLLRSVEEDFKRDQPFKGLKVALSIHLEAKTAYLCKVLAAGGAEMYITGSNPLSTQDDVAAGLVHDCGIKPGEAKYGAGHCTGKIQEQEGPSVARGLLQKVGYTPEKIERICYLVGHHHTYNIIDGLDYQLLVEADFIVNFYEDGTLKENIAKAVERIFKTGSGTKLVKTMFGL